MKREFECGVTASLLGGGRLPADAGNFAAVIGAAGVLLARSPAARAIFALAVSCWPLACYLGLRVTIDASLFKELALEEDGGGRALDQVLHAHGLLRVTGDRTLAGRSRGALGLWKRLLAVVAVQLAAVVAGTIAQTLAK